MKKKIAGLAALLLAASFSASVLALAKGDSNGDGEISAKDFKRLSKYLLGDKELEGETYGASDFDGNGIVNIVDLLLQKEMLLGTEGAETVVGVPEFSAESGFYSSEFSLTLTAGEGSKIYYTTDGSEPTQSSEVYSGPLTIKNRTSEPNVYSAVKVTTDNNQYRPQNVTKGTIVKAFSVDRDGNVSETVSRSYFVGIDAAKQYAGLPVVSLTIDPDDFFDYDKGIYVPGKIYDDFVASGQSNPMQSWLNEANYTQKGKEWEREVLFEIFENDGKLAHSQKIGARISGNATRSSIIKSLKFYARDDYGKKSVKYDLIPGNTMQLDRTTPVEKYSKFRMRNGGNDLGHAQFRDNYIQSLVADRAFDTQASRPAVMFINGEFFGVYTLQEDYCDSYIENNYDIDKKNVMIIECGKEVNDGEESDLAYYEELINFAKSSDFTKEADYKKISEMIDIQNFIDYQCTQIFIANQDWMNNNNNYRTWRSRDITDKPYEDGKWRWMLYDTEYSTSLYSMNGGTYGEDSLKIAMYGSAGGFGGFGGWGGGWDFGGGFIGIGGQRPGQQPGQQTEQQPKDHTVLFYKLLKNDEFKQRFVNTMMDLMNKNLSQENMLSELDRFTKMYEPVMNEQESRIGNSSNFRNELNNIKSFIQNREKNMLTFMKNDLNLTGQAAEISLSVNDSTGGTLMVNTISADMKDNKWSGTYFTDYPVTVKAVPAEGYVFSGWEGIEGNSDTITVKPGQAAEIKAKFTRG